ncbi:NAD-dependent epimerase [Thermococci archaeon]|nr:MAG: NAD-dependent epimerase [Thermococci archaeon]
MVKILVTGATGQIGSELVPELRKKYGDENVIATGRNIKKLKEFSEPTEVLDVLNKKKLEQVVKEHNIDVIYHLAAILSAKGEQNPQLCFKVNVDGLYNVLETARENNVEKVIIPSSIAAFGPETPDNPSEITIQRPKTMYGISKVLAELLGEYYYNKYGLDVRGVRFPGIISWKTEPGGGTTDYAVEAFYAAIQKGHYTYFVRKDTVLPMMYMPDALKALIQIAEAEPSQLRYRFYNVTGMSFSAEELTKVIQKFIPDFTADYKPDERQKIADSWPTRIDDSAAREDWNWKPDWDLERMARDMIENLSKKLRGDAYGKA